MTVYCVIFVQLFYPLLQLTYTHQTQICVEKQERIYCMTGLVSKSKANLNTSPPSKLASN